MKENIGFHYLLIKIQLYALSLFGIEDIPKEVLNKFRDNQILTIYLEYKIMNVLCMNFIGLLS